MALPASASSGTICIYNLLATGVNVLCEVEAHRTPVVCGHALHLMPSRLCHANGSSSVNPAMVDIPDTLLIDQRC